MEDNKHEIIKSIMSAEYYPSVFEETNHGKSEKIPFSDIAALGVAFEPLTSAFQNIFLEGEGKSGLYWVNVSEKGHLAKARDGSGFLGSVLSDEKNQVDSQARLTQLACDPTMLFMAAALMNIEKKLDSIREAQQDIVDFLEQKEKSAMKGDLDTLTDIINNYKYNWNNEKYKTNKHIHVQEIRRNSVQKIDFYREQLNKMINKQSILHRNKEVSKKLNDAHVGFKNYQLALYLYAFSSFLEIMLLENFDSGYLNSVICQIEDYSYEYKMLYTKCYDSIDDYAKTSMETHLLSGVAAINKFAGKAIAKIPVVSKSQLDETLIENSERLKNYSSKKAEIKTNAFRDNRNSGILIFIENIKMIDMVFNKVKELYFDKNNLYLCTDNNEIGMADEEN